MKTKAVFFLLLYLCLTACTADRNTYKIGVSQCAGGPWREKVNREMLAAQHLYEHDVKVDIADSNDDTQLQIKQIDSLANAGIDLLIVAPNEAAPIADAIARVRQKGIPVVFFDRKATTEDYTAFIGGNNVQAGQTAANYALSLLKPVEGRAKVLEITATMTTSPAQERHEGFSKVMQQHPETGYECVHSEWATESARRIMQQKIAAGTLPDIVFCHSDFMAMGAYMALKKAGLQGRVKIIGIDGRLDEGVAYVQKGYISATYAYPTHGEEIIRLALDILTGQPYQRDNYLPSLMVTPDNADTFAMNIKELDKQNEELITIHDKLENYYGLYNTQHKMLIASLVSILLLIIGALLTWRAAKQTRKAHRQMVRLNEEQTRFYTNASHQLKTPLTLIAGPVRQLLDSQKFKGEEQSLLEIVGRNIEQLESVTSRVLNFQKKENATVSDETASLRQDAATDATLQEARLAVMKQEDTEELPTILIVDDNADLRYYLRTLLSDRFYVLEAPDGQLGLKITRELVPDIVVSDVMMPVMNGLEFCKQLKADAVTSHIPVILLTARDTEAQQMEGYEHGADAYLTKPFSPDLLISRIYNLVKSRQQLRSLFEAENLSGGLKVEGGGETPQAQELSSFNPPPSTLHQKESSTLRKISSQDKLFADQLKEAIKKNMGNPSLKMDELGEEIGLSRVQLYRKVKALTGLSPVELLRQMRLQRGYTLLTTTTKTVNEIAYEVGFGTPGYFSKCFKQQFGKYPMEVRV